MMIDKDELVQALENVCRSMTDRKMDVRFRDGFAQAIIEVEGFKGTISQNEAATTNEDPMQKWSSVPRMNDIINSKKGRTFYLEERGCEKMIAVTVELDPENKRALRMTAQGDMAAGTVMKRNRRDFCKRWRLWDTMPGKEARTRLKWYSLEDDQ
jgi:hypothetical protein